jgi:hypothetical protein
MNQLVFQALKLNLHKKEWQKQLNAYHSTLKWPLRWALFECFRPSKKFQIFSYKRGL